MISFLFDFLYHRENILFNIVLSSSIALSIFAFILGLMVEYVRITRRMGCRKKKKYLVEIMPDGTRQNVFTFDPSDDIKKMTDKQLIEKIKEEREKLERNKEKEKEEKKEKEKKHTNLMFYFVVSYYVFKIFRMM